MGAKTVRIFVALGLLVALVALVSLSTSAAPAKPDCTKSSNYFDKGPDSRKYVHCRKGEVLFKECLKGKVWNQSKGSCEARGSQLAEENADAAELSIVPADWRSVHGWCWGWPIYHVTPVVVYRYRWVTGWHSGWYGRHYRAVALSEGGKGTQDEANGENAGEGDSGNSGEPNETDDAETHGDEGHSGEQASEHHDEQQGDQHNKEEHHELVEEHRR